ncbi:hypothetical protein ACFL6G_07665 [candidate division KSB1 bacterium]
MTGRLQFKGEYSTSAVSKCLMIGAIIFIVLYSGWFLLSNPETGANGDSIRNRIMFMCLVIYLLRFSVTLSVFLKRRIAWRETVLGAMLFPFLLYSFAFTAMQYSNPINVLDYDISQSAVCQRQKKSFTSLLIQLILTLSLIFEGHVGSEDVNTHTPINLILNKHCLIWEFNI